MKKPLITERPDHRQVPTWYDSYIAWCLQRTDRDDPAHRLTKPKLLIQGKVVSLDYIYSFSFNPQGEEK